MGLYHLDRPIKQHCFTLFRQHQQNVNSEQKRLFDKTDKSVSIGKKDTKLKTGKTERTQPTGCLLPGYGMFEERNRK